MRESDPTNPDPGQQDPESSAAADAPPPEEGGPAPGDRPSAGDTEEEGPPTERLRQDPAYEPGESGLKDIKGG